MLNQSKKNEDGLETVEQVSSVNQIIKKTHVLIFISQHLDKFYWRRDSI